MAPAGITAVPGADGNTRLYLALPGGRALPLPYQWRAQEFALDGNLQELAGGKVIALYDETTRTGALYFGLTAEPFWMIWQPCLRADFFERLVPAQLELSRGVLWA
jgi:hypothetical protein